MLAVVPRTISRDTGVRGDAPRAGKLPVTWRSGFLGRSVSQRKDTGHTNKRTLVCETVFLLLPKGNLTLCNTPWAHVRGAELEGVSHM